MLDKEFLDEVERYGITVRKNDIGKAVYYNGIPLPRTVDKSDEYMEAYIEGFLRHLLMSNPSERRFTRLYERLTR